MTDIHKNYINSLTSETAELSPIQKFYEDAVIFITGSTGFLGQLLLEKLLRSCPNISTIYVLVRNKKGKDVQTRVDELLDNVVFEKIKHENTKFKHKVIAIAGDCSLPDLGMSSQDRKLIANQVDIIFHVAATVRFDEKLKLAVNINIRATDDIIKLAKECPHLKSFIHVSTAFANCTSKVIEEKIYPPAIGYKNMIGIMENTSDEIFERMAPILVDKYPNTYAFTKQIAEDVVLKNGNGLPIGIFRPAIVISTYREPIKGWINNIYGPTGVLTGAGLGLFRILHCDGSLNANLVPADMTVNSLIATAWDVSERWKSEKYDSKDIPVYNYESSTENPLTWFEFMDVVHKYGLRLPSIKAVWYYCFILRKNYAIYTILAFLLHTVPALLIDLGMICVGKSPSMLKNYEKIHKFSSVISYFSTQSWIFKSYNIRKLCEKMSPKDQQLFFSDLTLINWDEFFRGYITGIRVYLTNDPMENLEQAKIRFRRLYWAHQVLKIVLTFLFLRALWFILSLFFKF